MGDPIEPVRETTVLHRCLCIILHPAPDGTTLEDHCIALAGPDQPFCEMCEEMRHPELLAQKPLLDRVNQPEEQADA